MFFLEKGKTNWKYIAIVVVLATIAGSGILWFEKKLEISFTQLPEVKSPKVIINEKTIDKFLIEDALLMGPSMPKEANYNAISAREAALIVVRYLIANNAKDIKIHHVLWFVAPFGGFYVAGECNFDREDNHYRLFVARIGDGSEGDVGNPTILFKGENKNIWSNNPEYLEPELYGEFLGDYKVMSELYNVTPLFTLEEIGHKKEINESEITSLFRKIFPNGSTQSDIDKITNINERAKAYFHGPVYNDFKSTCWGKIEYVQLDDNPDTTELLIHPYCEEKYEVKYIIEGWQMISKDEPFYVFRWHNSEWDLIGEIFVGFRSWYKIGRIKSGGFRDIIVGHHLSASSYAATRYRWNGKEYVPEEFSCNFKDDPEVCKEAVGEERWLEMEMEMEMERRIRIIEE